MFFYPLTCRTFCSCYSADNWVLQNIFKLFPFLQHKLPPSPCLPSSLFYQVNDSNHYLIFMTTVSLLFWYFHYCYLSGKDKTEIANISEIELVQKNKCFISDLMFSFLLFFTRILCKTTLYPPCKIQRCNFQGTSPWENVANAKSISRDHISYSHWELRSLGSYKQSWKGERAKRLKWKCSKFQINPSQHPKVVFSSHAQQFILSPLSLTQAVSVRWQQGLRKQKKKIWVFVGICIYQRIRKLAMTSFL